MATVTKPMALDETLQGTNTALGLLGKDATLQSIVTALATIGLNSVGNLASLTTEQKTSLVAAINEINAAKINTSAIGVANGVAELDNAGKIPSTQLPSFVDDVLEYSSVSAFPATGESEKIYVALDTNKTYRWSGSAYVEISPSLALGETSSTAYRGDRGKTAYDHSQDANRVTSATATGLYKIGATSQGHIAELVAVLKSDLTALGLIGEVTDSTTNGNIVVDGTEIQVYDDAQVQSDIEDIEGVITTDTTSASGNPLSIVGLKSTQNAINPVITLEPIQAGSGTPSPENIRSISGYDKIEVLSCGFNIWDEEWEVGTIDGNGGLSPSTNQIRSKNFCEILPNNLYYATSSKTDGGTDNKYYLALAFYDINKNYISTVYSNRSSFTSPANAYYFKIRTNSTTVVYGNTYLHDICINISSSKNGTYEPYHKTTDLSENLSQTVYGGSLDLNSGVLTVDRAIMDLGTRTYTKAADGYFYFPATDLDFVSFNSGEPYGICEIYQLSIYASWANRTVDNAIFGVQASHTMYVADSRYTTEEDIKDGLNGVKLCYKLATPIEIQLTPTELTLLKDYAYVSTNGTRIDLDYRNGAMATLEDTLPKPMTFGGKDYQLGIDATGLYLENITDGTKTYIQMVS